MSRFSIDIDYPMTKMALNRKRMEARSQFAYIDRVPVGFCLEPRYFAPILGLPYQDFFKDVETQYYWHLQFAKYRIENIPEDIFCLGPTLHVAPYFDNVINASAFGAEIIWPDDQPLRALPVIETPEAMDAMRIPAPDAGLWGTVLEWWLQMKEFAEQTKVTFNGVEGRVEVANLAISGEGPHMIAVDLVGTDFYWWMKEYPEQCHGFLDKITTGMIRAEKHFRKVDPRPRLGFGLAEDSCQIMSARMVKEFTLPYTKRMFDIFGHGLRDGRGMHMCGDSTHLLETLVEDARISSFVVFGYQVDPRIVARIMGGKVYLWGNINPMLMLDGSKEEVKETCIEALQAMAPCGGFILGDGANICPGTPLENMAVFTEAAEEFGLPEIAVGFEK
jgi:uroporphyrinogen-III decarboxylase